MKQSLMTTFLQVSKHIINLVGLIFNIAIFPAFLLS